MVGWRGDNLDNLRLDLWVLGYTLIFDINNISGMGISSSVGDNLSAAVRKDGAVNSRGRISVPLLLLSKVDSRVAVSNCIVIGVDWGCVWIGLHWSWMI